MRHEAEMTAAQAVEKLAREMLGYRCRSIFRPSGIRLAARKCSRPITCAYSIRKTGTHFCGIRACRWVLEQETGEQLDRFRRQCAAFMH
jgi:hypothetical protein